MKFLLVTALGIVMSGAIAGCGKMSDQDRLKQLVPNAQKTTPMQGQVLVDGKPVKDLWVKLHPATISPDSLLPKGQTDEKGNFKITSYIVGDGAPPGDYKITVEWLTFKQFGSQWVGPNKLDGPNGDAKSTQYSVTVAGQPIKLPPFQEKAKSGSSSLPVQSSDYQQEKRGMKLGANPGQKAGRKRKNKDD